MKKLVALLMSLCMILGVASAFAETDPMLLAFEQNLTNHIRNTSLNQYAFAFDAAGQYTGTFQVEGNLAELEVTSQYGQKATVQADSETIWISDGRQTYAVPMSEIQQLVMDLVGMVNPMAALSYEDQYTLQEFISLLAQKILMPCISATREGNATKITVNMTGEQLVENLGDFLRTAAAEPRYTGLIAKLHNTYAKLPNMINKAQMLSYGYASAETPEVNADFIAQQLTQAAGSIGRLDFVLNAEFVTGGEGLTGSGTLTINGSAASFELSADNGGFSFRLFDERMTYATLTGSFGERFGERFVNIRLDMEQSSMVTAELDATLGSNSLRATLNVNSRGRNVVNGMLNAMWINGAVDANLSLTSYGQSIANLNVHYANRQLSANLMAQGFSASLNAGVDNSGIFTGRLTASQTDRRGRVQNFEIAWDGTTLTINSAGTQVTATVRGISENEMAADIMIINGYNRQEATLLYTITDKEDGGWTLTVAATSNNETRTVTLGTADKHEIAPLSAKVDRTLTEFDLVCLITVRRLFDAQTPADAVEAPAEAPADSIVESW
ncbi:MAG: hypothetical protein IJK28_09450 [Clostridia bacterium]|nr:hypothetical protein [Clostridia bacterium]